MIDDQLLKDINKHLTNIKELKDWLNKVYYNEEFSGLFKKPVISMLISGAEYLEINLNALKQKYLARFEEIEGSEEE